MEEEILEGEVEEMEETGIMQATNNSVELIDKNTVIANMKAQQEIFKEFLNYVKENLEPKVDFYTVVEGAKPSLGQPGSEKILDFLRIYPKFVVTHRVLSRTEISYDVTCNLYSKTDSRQVGSGGGFCSSMEDNYLYEWVYEKNIPKSLSKDKLESRKKKSAKGEWFTQYRIELQNHYNVANTVKKMAFKRAMVDATLRSTFASHIFTQDLEDSYIGFVVKRQHDTGNVTPPKENPKDITNRDYWLKYNWDDKDMLAKIPTPGFDKVKNKERSSVEALRAYFYACDIMPKNEVQNFMQSIVGKIKSWEYTYGDVKMIVKALEEIAESQKAGETESEEEIQEGFEHYEQEGMV